MILHEWKRAYLAGLIDGEGSIQCQREFPRGAANYRYVLRLGFVLATEEPLRTVGSWLGVNPKWYPPLDDKRSARWRMDLPKGIAVDVLQACLPYLILKRNQAELVLAIEAVRAKHSPDRRHFGSAKLRQMPPEAISAMEELHQQLRALKSAKRPAQLRI